MFHRFAADLVLLAHLLFILFVLLGGLLALRWRWVPWIHLPAALWGAIVELGGWICPLTPLESWLRRSGGGAGYDESFLERYLLPVIYPAALTRRTQILLGLVPIVVNLIIYTMVWRRARSRRGPASESRAT